MVRMCFLWYCQQLNLQAELEHHLGLIYSTCYTLTSELLRVTLTLKYVVLVH